MFSLGGPRALIGDILTDSSLSLTPPITHYHPAPLFHLSSMTESNLTSPSMPSKLAVRLPTGVFLIMIRFLIHDYDGNFLTLSRQGMLYKFCLVCRHWYGVGVAYYLYGNPNLYQAWQFDRLVHAVGGLPCLGVLFATGVSKRFVWQRCSLRGTPSTNWIGFGSVAVDAANTVVIYVLRVSQYWPTSRRLLESCGNRSTLSGRWRCCGSCWMITALHCVLLAR
jgi:hypothetical protein